LLVLLQYRFPALNRPQLPTLMVLADLQAKRIVRSIQKNPEPLIIACNRAYQGELRALRFARLGNDGWFWDG
jgi:hypothetical protein